MKKLLFLDFESFWSPKEGYGLKEQSVVEYIRDHRFKAHGLGWETIGDDGIPGGKSTMGYRFANPEFLFSWIAKESRLAQYRASGP